MKISATKRVTIAGAGLAGSTLAMMFARRGVRVDLFERWPDPARVTPSGGRSVNLALGERARHALNKVGLLEAVDKFTVPMSGRMLHDRDGRQSLRPYGNDEGETIYSVHRARLNAVLIDAVRREDNIRLQFDRRLLEIDDEASLLRFEDGSGKEHAEPFDVLIGADGAGSAVRKSMQSLMDIGLSEELLVTGYKEFHIPPDDSGGFRLDANALHVWPRSGYAMVALPNTDGSFTATLFLPRTANDRMIWGFAELDSWLRQQTFMEANFPDATALIPDLEQAFRDNPVGILGTIRCRHWHFGGRILILGDAAHAIVPFHGQGVNSAMEDCVELIDCMEDPQRDWEAVFSELQSRRRRNTDAIADMALQSHEMMRESVRQPNYHLRQALEHELERRQPDRFVARYSLVMFHRMPYWEVYERGKIQAQILEELMEDVQSISEVDYSRAERLIRDRLGLVKPA
jgi:kynurenine 3-monooxygenase